MMEVNLTADEVALAASHAVLRRHQWALGKRGDREQNGRSTWDDEICGALAELAWCKLKGRYWTGAGCMRARDGGDAEIRWTHHLGTGGLIIYEHDEDAATFVLAEGYDPTIRFVGWLTGAEAKAAARWVGRIRIVPREKLRRFVPPMPRRAA